MAMNIVEINRIKRELTEQIGSITKNHSLTVEQKSVQLDQVEAKMAEMRTHEANSRRFSNILHGTGDVWQPRTKAMGMPSSAPAIMPDPEQTEALFNAVRTKQSLRVEVQTKTTNAIGGVAPAVLLPGLLERTHEPQRIMDALPATVMSAPSVAYLRHNSTTGSPATVAPGALKPELSFLVDSVTIRAAKIAAHVAVNDEDMADYHDFESYVGVELMRAIIDTENGQLLNGAGVGTDLSGMLNTTGALTRALGTDTPLDAVEQSINDLRVGSAFAVADLLVMHPTTRSKLRRQKDGYGRYLINPDPTVDEADALFGIPLVVTTTCPIGTVLVADARKAAMVYVRQGLSIETSPYNTDDFTHNLTRFRCEERLALATPRPAAMCIVTGL